MSLRWQLRWAVGKVRIHKTVCTLLATALGDEVRARGLVRLPQWLAHLPARARGAHYQRTVQNLELFDLPPKDIEACACRHIAIEWQKGIHQQRYPLQHPALLRTWIRSVAWVDPENHWQRLPHSPYLLVLLHTGEYWMAVARLVERYVAPTRFVIPIWNYRDPFTYGALMSLEGLGHKVEILDSNSPATALCIARRIRQGHQVIIFSDIPVSLNTSRAGEPVDGTLFGRAAQFVKGPMFLASRLGCPVLLAGHRVQLGSHGQLHAIAHIAHGEVQDMLAYWSKAMERFIRQAPEHWFYLSQMEAFYQRQPDSAQRRSNIPAALTKHTHRRVAP